MGFSNEVYRTASREMDKRRQAVFEKREKRKNIFYSRFPRGAEIEREIASTSVKAAKEIFSGKADIKERLNQLKENNLNLQKELIELLVSAGFPENYLDEQYECNLCKDTGYTNEKMCSCMKQLLRNIAYDELNKISPLSLCDFNTFDITLYSSEALQGKRYSPQAVMSKIYSFCMDYANNFTLNSKNLLLRGATGLGKTHLSLAIAKNVINKGYGVIYVSTPNIVNKLEKERFSQFKNYAEETENIITNCDLLIFDDLGTEFSTSYSNSMIYNIINTRIISGKPTIINTNLTISELGKIYSERFVSRIMGDFERFDFVGKDIRQIKKQQR